MTNDTQVNRSADEGTACSASAGEPRPREKRTSAPAIVILGVPFDNVTTSEAVSLVEEMIASRRPHYAATANIDFLVQALHDVELRRILFDAHLVICDGTPLVWASRMLGNPLPERVAGSDLVPLLIGVAAQKGYRLFFLGGSSEATEAAVGRLRSVHPSLQVAGAYSPPFSHLLEMDHEEIRRRIAAAKPDLLFVSFGCPKQEKWIWMHYRTLGVPFSVGVGGTIDFLAGRLNRAPLWMRKAGLEWVFRLLQEPGRLGKRYLYDLWAFGLPFFSQWWQLQLRRKRRRSMPENSTENRSVEEANVSAGCGHGGREIQAPDWLDMEAVHRVAHLWEGALGNEAPGFLLLDKVRFIDSTGVGLLIRLHKRARLNGHRLFLVTPSDAVLRALKSMKLDEFFHLAADLPAAQQAAARGATEAPVERDVGAGRPILAWRGEVTAANAAEVWAETEQFIIKEAKGAAKLRIGLNEVTFLDSTGVSLMIRAKKFARQHEVELRFTDVRPSVRNVLRLSKLEEYLLDA